MQRSLPHSQRDQPAAYAITVRGRLDASWSAWFDDLAVTIAVGDDGQPTTTLTGPVTDQVALHGLLARIRDLDLPILLVRRMDEAADSERTNG